SRFEVVVGAGRPVAAERELVTRYRAGHAQRGVSVVMTDAEAEAHELAERVELFGHQLSGGEDRDRIGTVPLERAGESPHNPVDGVRPRRGLAVDQRNREPAGGGEGLVLAQALRTQTAAVDGMIGITVDRDGSALLDAEQHPATDRAIAA